MVMAGLTFSLRRRCCTSVKGIGLATTARTATSSLLLSDLIHGHHLMAIEMQLKHDVDDVLRRNEGEKK